MINYIKSNIFLIKLVLFLVLLAGITFYIFTLKNEIKTLKNHEKMQLNRISTLKTEIKALKENGEIAVVNAEISESSKAIIKDLNELKKVDQLEESKKHDHTYDSTSILGGYYLLEREK